jgi:hypothetical protein
MALIVESGWFEIVLRLQASHLYLKCTTFGYGSVLTAACACRGCSATDCYYHIIIAVIFILVQALTRYKMFQVKNVFKLISE